MAKTRERQRKSFPTFDCDAHINDPLEIWSNYVEPEYRDLVKQSYWQDSRHTILNGKSESDRQNIYSAGPWNSITIAGPGVTRKAMRYLAQNPLTPEQKSYLDHKGAYDPHARVRDNDLMGIDQVMIVPTMPVSHLPRVQNAEGGAAFARAYNNWVADYCSYYPDRLYPAGILPQGDPIYSAEEVSRVAKKDFKVVLLRPVEGACGYPNRIYGRGGSGASFDEVFRAFEDTGMILGMHSISGSNPDRELSGSVAGAGYYLRATTAVGRPPSADPALAFWFEASVWVAQVLLSGFLDRYPKLRMAIFESNATWVLPLLEQCDRLFECYRRERTQPAKRLPSEAFFEQCFHAFEGDERGVFRRWERFENIGIWSSDVYHQDSLDAWETMREMDKEEVPERVRAKLMGANAARMYGIPQKLFCTEEPTNYERPAWYPKEEELDAWWEQEKRGGVAAAGGPARLHQVQSD